MENRVAVMSIIVENPESVEPLNELLHESREYIIGRMGIPYRARNISIISIALDAPLWRSTKPSSAAARRKPPVCWRSGRWPSASASTARTSTSVA